MTNDKSNNLLNGVVAVISISCCLFSVVIAGEERSSNAGNAASNNYKLEEVVVTAQRRSENLSDVPVAVTVLLGEGIRKRRVQALDDIATYVPSLQINSVIGENTPIFSLRGVSMSDYSLNQQGPVATYVDDVYRGSSTILGVSMFDVDRVEVLRGPQGTLYGKNTTGGAVKIFSRKPELEEYNGYVSGGIGNFGRQEAAGAINIPLSNTTAVRIAGVVTRADGWFENQVAGQPDLNATREYGLRGTFLWEPKLDTLIVLRASISEQDPINYGIRSEAGEFGVGAGLYAFYNSLFPIQNPNTDYFRTGLGDHEIESDQPRRRNSQVQEIALTMDFPISDDLNFTSVSSWTDGEMLIPEESDGSPLRVLELPQFGETTQLTQDLRVTSDYSSKLNFILGAFYGHEKTVINNKFIGFADIDATGDGLVNADDCTASGYFICNYENNFEQIKKSYAVYSDFTYELSEKITLTGGLRYTNDEGEQNDYKSVLYGIDGTPLFNLIPGTAALDGTIDLKTNSDNVSGRAVIDIQLDNGALVYASVNRGYRGGAFNAQAYVTLDELTTADPETIMAYEVGVKHTMFNRTLQYAAGIFYYDYRDQQFLDIDTNALQRVTNIEKSRVLGAELELTFSPVEDLVFNSAFSWLDTEVRAGELRGIDLVGNNLPNSPDFSFTASMDWSVLQLEQGDISLNLNAKYTNSQYFGVVNDPRLIQKSYGLLNGQLAYTSDDIGLEVSVWAKNIFDEFYYSNRIDVLSYGFDYNHIGAPRTFGASIRKSF